MSSPENTQPPQYTPPPAPAPAYDSTAAPAYGASGSTGTPGPVPGKTLGIVALIVAFFANIIGLILGIVALVQSRKAGVKNLPAVWAIIVGGVLMVIWIIAAISLIAYLGTMANDIVVNCGTGGSGFVEIWGQQVSCTEINS